MDRAPRALPGSTLRIGMVAPPWFEVPPSGYGGIEAVVADLVDQLVARGHEVHLVAAGRPLTTATAFHRHYEVPPSDRLGSSHPEVVQAVYAAEVLKDLDLDVIHDHTLVGPLMAGSRQAPTLVTMHGPVTGEFGDYVAMMTRSVAPAVDLVAISDSQRGLAPGLPWIGRVHNAVDVATYPYREAKDDFVLWLGRFTPDKGPHLAIDAARAAGRRIVLAGKLNEAGERDFFDAEIRHRLGPDAEYVGEADATLKRELFAAASCMAFPLQWEEPFGIVMVESMACGTPVVALRRGSAPEVIGHGEGGLVVDTFDEFVVALDKARDLDPAGCRRRAAEHFDLPVMAAGYERVYREVVAAHDPSRLGRGRRRPTLRSAAGAQRARPAMGHQIPDTVVPVATARPSLRVPGPTR